MTPRKLFNPGAGSFGAVELAGRYTQLNVDNDAFILKFANPNTSASRDSTWTAGVNWYFNRNLKLQLNYEQSAFKGGSTTGNRQTEKVILSRFPGRLLIFLRKILRNQCQYRRNRYQPKLDVFKLDSY